MKTSQRGDAFEAFIWALMILIVLAIGGAGLVTNYYKCHARWDRSGMIAVEYGPLQGCMIQRKDGTWMPANTIRDVTP
jgi:hypothetical protein